MENIFAQKLKRLRETRNYSLQDLADLVGVAKQTIHKFEQGLINPSSETKLKIANVFNKPYSFFYEVPAEERLSLGDIKFREVHKIFNKEGLENEIKQEVCDYISRFLDIEAIMDVDREFENPLTGLPITSDKDIEKAAKLLRKKWKVGNVPIPGVFEMLENNGVFVVEVYRHEDFTGLAGILNAETPIIVVNERCLNVERKRFTALHELGHIVLDFPDDITDRKLEYYCDSFAGAVLLVDEVLLYELGKNRTLISLAELKRIKILYGISIQSIIVRAKVCGFIKPATYHSWWKDYELWSKDKTNDFGHGSFTEKSTRLNCLLAMAVAEKRISIAKAAELANRKIDEIKEDFGEKFFSLN